MTTTLATHRMVAGRMRRRDRCNQGGPNCLRYVDPNGRHRNCLPCRQRLALHSKDRVLYIDTRIPRMALKAVTDDVLRLTWIPRSMNRKLGPIPATIVTPSTCPPSCAFWGAGCYAESGPTAAHWSRAGTDGISWSAFLRHVRALPPRQLWRYGIAGDLPGVGDTLHVGRLRELSVANRFHGAQHARAMAYTHKPLRRADERRAVRNANVNGFTINLSANNLEHADRLADLGIAPVVVVVPEDAPMHLKTPADRHVVLCPATTPAELDCARCGLCAVASRKSIVAFPAHGQSRRLIDDVVRLPVVGGAGP